MNDKVAEETGREIAVELEQQNLLVDDTFAVLDHIHRFIAPPEIPVETDSSHRVQLHASWAYCTEKPDKCCRVEHFMAPRRRSKDSALERWCHRHDVSRRARARPNRSCVLRIVGHVRAIIKPP